MSPHIEVALRTCFSNLLININPGSVFRPVKTVCGSIEC